MWGWPHDTLEKKGTREIASWIILTQEVILKDLKIASRYQPHTWDTDIQLYTDRDLHKNFLTQTWRNKKFGVPNIVILNFWTFILRRFHFCSVISPWESNNRGGLIQNAQFWGIIHVVIIWANCILSGELYSPMQMGIIWDGKWNEDKILCLGYCVALELILLVSYSNPL